MRRGPSNSFKSRFASRLDSGIRRQDTASLQRTSKTGARRDDLRSIYSGRRQGRTLRRRVARRLVEANARLKIRCSLPPNARGVRSESRVLEAEYLLRAIAYAWQGDPGGPLCGRNHSAEVPVGGEGWERNFGPVLACCPVMG